MTKVLVTGADGFIGSHLTEALVRKGFDLRAFILYNSFNSWGWLDYADSEIKKQIEVYAGDVRDPQRRQNRYERMRYNIPHSSVDCYPLFVPLS